MDNNKEDNQMSFICYNCKNETIINRSSYIDKDEEYFLEAAGTVPTKEVIIPCTNCKTLNKITITY